MIFKVFTEHEVGIVVMKIIAFLIIQGSGLHKVVTHLVFSKSVPSSNTQKIQKIGELSLVEHVLTRISQKKKVLLYHISYLSHIYKPYILSHICAINNIYHIYFIYIFIYFIYITNCICHVPLYNI